MKKITLILFAFAFLLSLNTYAQDATNSNDVKKPDVTKPTNVQKTTDVTNPQNTTTPVDSKTLQAIKNTTVTKTTSVTKTALVTKGTGIPVNKVCIVSGEEIDSKITADYKSKTYAFCCKTCLKKFTKDPEKYVAKFDKSSKNKN
jgi:YHS domain-containing protein